MEFMQLDVPQHDPLREISSFLKDLSATDKNLILSQYISNYQGYTYYNRLIFIALHYPELQGEALKLAEAYIKENTYDTISYGKIFEILYQTARSDIPVAASEPEEAAIINRITQAVMGGDNIASLVYDKVWIEHTRRTSTFKLEQLDTDLKNYQANSVKDNVRRVSDELGDLYLKMGNFDKSLKCYLRSRDNCTSSFQELLSCINIIRIYIYQEGWPFVNANFSKGDSLIDIKDSVIIRADPDSSVNNNSGYNNGLFNSSVLTNKELYAIAKSQLAIAGGLYQLTLGKYRTASLYFIQVNGDYQDSYNDILSISDVIYYASLCSLASMERNEIGRFVMGSSCGKTKNSSSTSLLNTSQINNFKQLLESEPKCRDMLKFYYIADYSSCLRILERLCLENLYLDCYLAQHLKRLVAEIRNKALCQYFSPYMSADLQIMANKFNTNPFDLQKELISLIQSRKMKARIDSAKGLLKALSVDQRKTSFAQALNQADDFFFNSQKALIRMAIAKNKLCTEPDPLSEGEEKTSKPKRSSIAQNAQTSSSILTGFRDDSFSSQQTSSMDFI